MGLVVSRCGLIQREIFLLLFLFSFFSFSFFLSSFFFFLSFFYGIFHGSRQSVFGADETISGGGKYV